MAKNNLKPNINVKTSKSTVKWKIKLKPIKYSSQL